MYAKAVVVCLLFVSFVPRRDTRREEEEEGKNGSIYFVLFCLYIYRNGRRRRRTSSFLTAAGIALFPPTFSFLGPFFKNSHGDPKRKQQKKEKDRRESGKRPDVLCFFLYFSYVYIDLCIAHTQVLRLPSNTMTQLEIDNFSVENKFFENSNFAL